MLPMINNILMASGLVCAVFAIMATGIVTAAAVGDVEDSDFYVPDEGDLVFYGRDRRDPGLPVAVAATSGDVPASGDVKWTLGLGVLSNMQQFFDSLRTNLESLEQLPHEDKEALLGQHVASAPAIMLGLELEQRTNIKFLVKLGKSKSEIREMLVKVYGDNAMKKTAVHKWAKRFSAGRESVTDEERSGRPATSRTGKNIAKVRQIVRENCRLTVRGIAQQAKIDRETVRKILTEDLDMRKIKGQHSVRKRQRPTSTPSATTALLTKSETSLVSPNQQPYVEATTTTQTGYGPGSDEGANTPPFPIGCPHRATARQIVTITTEHLKQGLQQ